MKTLSIQQARNQFDELLKLVATGQTVELTDQSRTVARIVPADSSGEEAQVDWSDAQERLKSLWNGKPTPGQPASRIIIEDRR